MGAGVGEGLDEAVAVLGRQLMAIQGRHGGERTVLRYCALQSPLPTGQTGSVFARAIVRRAAGRPTPR